MSQAPQSQEPELLLLERSDPQQGIGNNVSSPWRSGSRSSGR